MLKQIFITGLAGVLFSCLEVPTSLSSTMKETTNMPNYSHPYVRINQLTTYAAVAMREDAIVSQYGLTVSDPYQWLKDQGYPEVNDQTVLDYLHAENAFFVNLKRDISRS